MLLVVNHVLVRYLFQSGRLDKLEGSPDVLILNGVVAHDRLAKELITLAELESAARRQGIGSMDQVRECRLETGGALTFIAKTPTPVDQQHHELVTRLARIEEILARLAPRDIGDEPGPSPRVP